ncbi:N-carbamoyl-L-amino acid amidohydrolase [Hyphococcus lacteus]|uniref:N-carbamoyl-L-amino acid amidohydrolase n=1 Tax=Hyphococcus lacteus TaxID=3143536 RepID=A0ABV3Z081_9PROT
MKFNGENSPYVRDEKRLADVIAAIQTLGTYRFYKMDFKGWADRISGDENLCRHWETVFKEHPEFFRLDATRDQASLVIRRQHSKLFNVDNHQDITKNEFLALNEEQKSRVSRSPLSPEEISTLINTAVLLHARAIEHKRNMRWWIPILTAGIAGLSATIGAFIGSISGSG